MPGEREVWKIGGSILQNESAYHQCARRIKQHLEANPQLERLYVVVSAAFGVTDSLVSQVAGNPVAARKLNAVLQGQASPDDCPEEWDKPGTAMRLLQGELNSVHALRIALLLQGLSAKTCTQCDYFPITAEGSFLRAVYSPAESALRFRLFDQICRDQRLVILSGFGGVDSRNQPVILGRNASDFVAALLTLLDSKVSGATFIKESGAVFTDFETPQQRAISHMTSDELLHEEFSDVLDLRVLSAISCDFRVCGLDLQGGTWIARNKAEAEVVKA